MKKYLWAIAAAVLASWGISLYQAANRLSFRPLIPSNIAFNQGALRFILPLVAFNDSNRILPVSGYAFDIYLNGSFLAKAYAFNVPFINPGDNVINTEVLIPILDLVNTIPELRNGGRTVVFRLSGNVRLLELLTIPVPDFNISITIPKISI